MTAAAITITEVGPRDGLQSIPDIMPTAAKRAWLSALVDAGVKEIEVGSFVRPDLLPQMADTAEVVAHALTLPGLTVTVLVPNLHGARKALEAGAHRISVPVSASEAHSLANVRKTPAQMVDEVRAMVALRNDTAPTAGVEVGISTAFGCTLQGAVPADDVVRLAAQLVQAGADSCGLSDTTGYAHPVQIRSLFRRLHSEIGERAGAAHLHNTRGLGLANCLAALDAGVTAFDSSQAGLGGCPYAPGASGNVVTEDLVYMMEAMGLATGIGFEGLRRARQVLADSLPGTPLYGMVHDAGLPLGFRSAGHD